MSKKDEINQKISERLKTIQEGLFKPNGKNVTQVDIANKCGLSKDTISRAFRGDGVSIENAFIISDALNISLDYLYGKSEYENEEKYAQKYIIKFIDKHIEPKKKFLVSNMKKSVEVPLVSMNVMLMKYIKTLADINAIKKTPKWGKHVEHTLQETQKEFLENIKEIEDIERLEGRNVMNSYEYVIVDSLSLMNDDVYKAMGEALV